MRRVQQRSEEPWLHNVGKARMEVRGNHPVWCLEDWIWCLRRQYPLFFFPNEAPLEFNQTPP